MIPLNSMIEWNKRTNLGKILIILKVFFSVVGAFRSSLVLIKKKKTLQ